MNVVVELVDEGTIGPFTDGDSTTLGVDGSFRDGLGELSELPLIVASALFISSYDTALANNQYLINTQIYKQLTKKLTLLESIYGSVSLIWPFVYGLIRPVRLWKLLAPLNFNQKIRFLSLKKPNKTKVRITIV